MIEMLADVRRLGRRVGESDRPVESCIRLFDVLVSVMPAMPVTTRAAAKNQ